MKEGEKTEAFNTTKQAVEKLQKGNYQEAILDFNRSIQMDSAISYNYGYKGYCLLRQDSTSLALINIKKAIALNDTDATFYYYLGDAYLKSNKITEAESAYSRAYFLDKNFYDALFNVATINILKKNYEAAENLFLEIIAQNPKYTMAYFTLAQLYSVTDQDKTMRYLNKTIVVDPNFAPAFFLRGFYRLSQSDMVSIPKDWHRAIEIDSTNILYRIFRGFLYITQGRFNMGIEELSNTLVLPKLQHLGKDFEKSASTQRMIDFFSQLVMYNTYADKINPKNKNQINKALSMFYLGDHQSAEDTYKQVLKNTNTKGLIYYLRGFNQEYRESPTFALDCYKTAMKETDFPFETYLRLGKVTMDMGNNNRAIAYLDTFISKNDSSKLAYRCRGITLFTVQKYDSAIYDFNHFLKLDSLEFDIYYDRAICYKLTGRYAEAMKDFNKVIEQDSKDMESIYFLAECKYVSGDSLGAYKLLNTTFTNLHELSAEGYYLKGMLNIHYSKFDLAVADLDVYILNYPGNKIALLNRGKAHYGNRNYQKAIKDFTEVVQLDDKNADAFYCRGLAYKALSKKDEARLDFQSADALGHALSRQAITNL